MESLHRYRDMFSLENRVAVIAGGSGGIGSSVSEGFAAMGAAIVIADSHSKRSKAVAEKILAMKPKGAVTSLPIDVLEVSSIEKGFAAIQEQFGRIDVLVNCVGTHIEAPAESYQEEAWDTVLSVNLKAAFFLSQAAARIQILTGSGGSHIHLSSVRSALGIARGYSAYCASKGGLNMLVRQLATEWAGHGIRVNGIAPTFTRTPLVTQYLEDPDFLEALIARIPAGRICEPADLTGLALFLAMPASDFIQGQIIFADGGLTATQ